MAVNIQPEILRRKKAVFRRNTLCISRKLGAFPAEKIGCRLATHLCDVAFKRGEIYSMDEIKRIKALLAEDRPVEWEALPDIDLYMDQVVSYLPRQSVGGKAPAMTPAMINNYVKDGLLPRACGKRYHKEHLISLTAIGLLKNVLTVKDMKLLLDREVSQGQEQAFYEKLLKGIDEAYSRTNEAVDAELSEDDLTVAAMQLALTSCAAKAACEEILGVIREKYPEEDPKARKEREKEEAKRAKAERKAAEKAEEAEK